VESSSLSKTVAKYDTTMAELRRYHWSFCGSTYAEPVTGTWRKNGTFEEMERKLGYRYQLISATLPDKGTAGQQTQIRIQLRNTGFAPLYNERHAYIVLRDESKTYSIALQSDPRRWLPNDAVTTIEETITLPADIPAGTYRLYLHMPDASASLADDPRYAVRFANTDVWDAATGMNSLHASLVITDSASGIDRTTAPNDAAAYDVLGRPVNSNYRGIVIQKGYKRIHIQ
jgi:hypothetical protein